MKNDSSHAVLLEAQELGHEARADTSDHAALRLWLRMLSCTTQIETEIRRRLRVRFGVSLARFDYLAQLYRSEDGLKMRELARRLMVTGGNVTGLTDDLERTIDYSKVFLTCREVVESTRFLLIEALGEAIAEALFASYPADEVTIRIRKPAVDLDGPFRSVGIEIRRARAAGA